jgi:hypothetical protein
LAIETQSDSFPLILAEVAYSDSLYSFDHIRGSESQPNVRATRANDDLFQFHDVLVHVAGHIIPTKSQNRNGAYLESCHSFYIPLRS